MTRDAAQEAREQRLRIGLAFVFGDEWGALSADDQRLILRDCTEDGGVDDLAAYRRAIGVGNLSAYVLTQRVRFRAAEPAR